MKNLLVSLLMLSGVLYPCINAEGSTITSNPSPAVSNKALEITISGKDMGSQVYCYTWCCIEGATEKAPYSWNEVNNSRFQMTKSGNSYSYKIADIKSYYSLTDAELAKVTKLGFIAKNANGGQTEDLFVEVVQGRGDAYSGGEGTISSPFILKKAQDLKDLASAQSDWTSEYYFRMDADIDASGLESSIGTTGVPFSATFDGNGHTISNVRLQGGGVGTAAGLFGAVRGGTIRRLGVINAVISGQSYVGALVGYLESGLVEQCFTSGTVTGNSVSVGGLVGENVSGNILNCYSGANVNNLSDYATGGVAGKNQGTIKNTYSAGKITGYDYVGGLVGANYGSIKNSVALNGEVTAYHDFVARFGGNNNPQNATEFVYSWESIPAGHQRWSSHGDHAVTNVSDIFRNESQFRQLTGWDFDNVWEWKVEGTKEYPVLKGFVNQPCMLSDNYFDSNFSEIETISAEAADRFRVGPNPTDGPVRIGSREGLREYALFSINGTLILSAETFGEQHVEADLSGLAKGIYLLRLIDNSGESATVKIMKK
ncbi:MAG: T9SS type A sorting domain-containing protein [Muribaculaceae bacterium]|nr:T9SS type A sorting domain-containing protein [Muribaculaceae bacterium]